MTYFKNRQDAGAVLAKALSNYANNSDTLLIALPRGGVPVAAEMAKILNLPLEICLVRKLGAPAYPELAIGAISTNGTIVLNNELLEQLSISPSQIAAIEAKEQIELARRNKLYRQDRPFPELTNKTLILIDDGLATGATMQAAVMALREKKPKDIIVAVPVSSSEACRQLAKYADQAICLFEPKPFHSVGEWYEDFSQTSDQEVINILTKSFK